MYNFMKKISLNKPNRKEIKIAVTKFLEDGGDIKKIKYNENLPNVNEFIKYLQIEIKKSKCFLFKINSLNILIKLLIIK